MLPVQTFLMSREWSTARAFDVELVAEDTKAVSAVDGGDGPIQARVVDHALEPRIQVAGVFHRADCAQVVVRLPFDHRAENTLIFLVVHLIDRIYIQPIGCVFLQRWQNMAVNIEGEADL